MAEEVVRHETGPNVVMNCAAYSNNHHMYLVSGQESHSQLYHIKTHIVDEDEKENVNNHTGNNVKHRKNASGATANEKQNHSNKSSSRRLTFEIKPSDSIQTDFRYV